MSERSFCTEYDYLHIPVKGGNPEDAYYIDVFADGEWKNEFLIAVQPLGEPFDFYVALDMKRYNCKTVTLICREENAPENLFESIIPGGKIKDEVTLYPDLYKEEIRQQIHFSPARGWMNDPNGLFYKDGIFHTYFQHNPFGNHNDCTNVSWGHAISRDGVHFEEINDAIMPRNSRLSVASGSAIIDTYNMSGFGNDTILAAYTDLFSIQYHGRPPVTSGGAQNLMYSTDGGMTFSYFENNPIIPVPDNEKWRDPKILQIDENTLCIAVFEIYDGKYFVSFYKSSDCRNWEFCSREADLCECPDLFKITVCETGEEKWVLYGGDGIYKIGNFEDFRFITDGGSGRVDYGDCVYAGQTFNNFDDAGKRLHLAWMRDYDHAWYYSEDDVNKRFGFSQSMSFMTELLLHKTKNGYTLFRKPVEAVKELRKEKETIRLSEEVSLPVPSEVVLKFNADDNAEVKVCGAGFLYNGKMRKFTISSGYEYELCSAEKEVTVRIFTDTRTVEFFVEDEMSMSFFVKDREKFLCVKSQTETANLYRLESIWS